MVDDQTAKYSADALREMKAAHEAWVETKLRDQPAALPPIRRVRFKSEIPKAITLVESGQELFNLASLCHASYQHHSELESEAEVEQVGGFLQNLQDWVDVAGDGEPLDKVRAAKAMSDEISELKENGFLVFAARERQQLEGGVGPPSPFWVLHIYVLRHNDPQIIRPSSEPSA